MSEVIAADEFVVRLARSGRELGVPPDRSIVDVLRAAGIEVETSCEQGVCGTCRTRYLEGSPDHRDFVLTDGEQATDVMICCARSFAPVLVLDL
jgi:ferredoxin